MFLSWISPHEPAFVGFYDLFLAVLSAAIVHVTRCAIVFSFPLSVVVLQMSVAGRLISGGGILTFGAGILTYGGGISTSAAGALNSEAFITTFGSQTSSTGVDFPILKEM